MPGPVSDSYDPEFGTGENANDVREAITQVRDEITAIIGDPELMDIVRLSRDEIEFGPDVQVTLSERELRIIRFCMNRALESI